MAVGDPEFIDKYLNAAKPLRFEIFGSADGDQCIGTAELRIESLEVCPVPDVGVCHHDQSACLEGEHATVDPNTESVIEAHYWSVPPIQPSAGALCSYHRQSARGTGALWVMMKRLQYPSPDEGMQKLITPLVAPKITTTLPSRTEDNVIEPRKRTAIDEKVSSVLSEMLARGTPT